MADRRMKDCDNCKGAEPSYPVEENTVRTTIFRGKISGQTTEDMGPVCIAKLQAWLAQEAIELKPLRLSRARVAEPDQAPAPPPEPPVSDGVSDDPEPVVSDA